MRVVALRGLGDCGKSQTIAIAFDALRQRFPEAQVEFLHHRRKDVCAILRTQHGAIGVESQGDPGFRLPESLARFVGDGCHAILCATRSRGATCDAVEALSPPYELRWVDQRRVSGGESDFRAANVVMAGRLVDAVMQGLRS